MPTLLLSSRHTPDSQAIWRAATQRGWNVHRIPGWRIPDHIKPIEDPVVYTDALVGPMLAQELGVSLVEPPADWLPGLPEEYCKRRISSMSYGEARQLSFESFVKPPNDKSFEARVYAPGELLAEMPDSDPVLVSEVVTWESEFRCFILNRTLHTYSIYLRNGELQNENEFVCEENEAIDMREFLAPLLVDSRVPLPVSTVIDVGVIAGRGWAVVEQNGPWAAGIYGCDPDLALDVIERATVRQR